MEERSDAVGHLALRLPQGEQEQGECGEAFGWPGLKNHVASLLL